MKDLIIIAAEEFIDKWNQLNNTTIPYINHKFDLKGHTAGQFWFRSTNSWFRWNLPIAEQNSDHYLIQTVGHEVAHYLARKTYSYRITPHGWEWKQVMQKLGLEPARCHNYSTTPARIVARPFKYICPCTKIYNFTATKFKNMVLRGLNKDGQTKYRCCICNTYINIKQVKPI